MRETEEAHAGLDGTTSTAPTHAVLMMMFVLFCFVTLDPKIRVRCAVHDGRMIHDYTEQNRDKPLGLTGAREGTELQHLIRDTPQDAFHRCEGHSVLQEDSHLCGSLADMLALKQKNTHRSILSDKEHESSVVSMLARALQKRAKKHIPFSLFKTQLEL